MADCSRPKTTLSVPTFSWTKSAFRFIWALKKACFSILKSGIKIRYRHRDQCAREEIDCNQITFL